MDVRNKYLKERHRLINSVKQGDLKQVDLEEQLKLVKDKIIDKSCAGLELCKRAINFCVDKDLLPLTGTHEKFSLNLQNPYNARMPSINLRIDLPKEEGPGKKIVDTLTKLKGGTNYFAEPIKESAEGQVPNFIAIKKAINTFENIKDPKAKIEKIDDMIKSCSPNAKSGITNLKRKMSFLWLASDNDVFFEYLGHIRDFQLANNN
jgi:hypothetical protein